MSQFAEDITILALAESIAISRTGSDHRIGLAIAALAGALGRLLGSLDLPPAAISELVDGATSQIFEEAAHARAQKLQQQEQQQ